MRAPRGQRYRSDRRVERFALLVSAPRDATLPFDTRQLETTLRFDTRQREKNDGLTRQGACRCRDARSAPRFIAAPRDAMDRSFSDLELDVLHTLQSRRPRLVALPDSPTARSRGCSWCTIVVVTRETPMN